MENKDKTPKNFKKVKAKKNLYKDNNPLLNSPINNIKDIENNNKFIKKAIKNQKNLDFVNNSDFIKEAVFYSKLKNLKKNLAYKNNDNSELNNILSQRNEKINDEIKLRKNKKIIFDLKQFNSNENNNQNFNSFYLNNNEFISNSNTGKNFNNETKFFEYNIDMGAITNKSLRENNINSTNYNLNKNNKNNKNILIIEEENKNYGITERRKPLSIEKIFENRKYNTHKRDVYSDILFKNKNNNINDKPINNTSNSILNVTVEQIKESPLYEKIKMPKVGHSRGIIEMIKNFNETAGKNPQIEKFNDKNILRNYKSFNNNINDNNYYTSRKKNTENNNNNYNNNNNIKKKIKCLNDQKVFDEPKNKTYINNTNYTNYSYKKKILNTKNNSTSKKKSFFKQGINKTAIEQLNIHHNKTLSFNNNIEIKMPSTPDDLTDININQYDNQGEFMNNSFAKKDNYLYKKYTTNNSNNSKNKSNSFYQKMKNSKAINIKFSSNNNFEQNISDLEMDYINENNKNNFICNTQSESDSEINNKKNNPRKTAIGSPMIKNKIKYYRNQFLNEHLEDDSMYYKTLPNISRTLKRNKAHFSRNNQIEEININMRTTSSKKEQDNENMNNTNNYFYSRDNLSFLKNDKKDKNEFNSPRQQLNFDENRNTINTDINIKRKKLTKINSSINFNNNKQLLYLKPKNKQNKNLKLLYSKYNNNNNNNYNNINDRPQTINPNQNSPFFIKNYQYPNSRYNTNDSQVVTEQRSNKFRGKPYRRIDIDDAIYYDDEIKKKSLPKQMNKVYKKPINKNIMNNAKVSPKFKDNNNIDSNSLTYKDEIIYIDKENNPINEYNQYKNNSKIIEEYNKIYGLNNYNYEYLYKTINKNKKNCFMKKYYNHCIQIPKSKQNYFTNKHIYIFKKKKNKKKIMNVKISKCYFTKNTIFKYKKEKNNLIDIKNYRNKRNNSNNLNKKENIKKNNDKNVKNEKKNIKNDIIYLLNNLTSKNILSIENQLTKVIITSNNVFNIENNGDNAKLFLYDIINNENIFIDILINKVISDNTLNEIYSKLCSDLCNKYLNSINEILVNKLIDTKNKKDEYNIIKNLKLKLNEKCISQFDDLLKNDINNENKQKILNLINFMCQSLDYEIIEFETCLNIINKLFNAYEINVDKNKKYHYLDLIIYLVLKLEKIKHLKDMNDLVEKIINIINNDINENDIPSTFKNRIITFKKTYKVKDINNEEKKIKSKNTYEGIDLLIKGDMEKYFIFFTNRKTDFITNIKQINETQYDWSILKSLKRYDLEDIINSYINICANIIINQDQITCYKNYIKNIIESISYKLSLSKLRAFHNKILQILSNIHDICSKNEFMYEIIGYLLYILIINELCDIEDINIFINKDNKSKITIAKIIAFTILSFEDNSKKYYEDFKNIDLFKYNKDIFEQHITDKLKDKPNI